MPSDEVPSEIFFKLPPEKIKKNNDDVMEALQLVNHAYNILNCSEFKKKYGDIPERLLGMRNEISWLLINEE